MLTFLHKQSCQLLALFFGQLDKDIKIYFRMKSNCRLGLYSSKAVQFTHMPENGFELMHRDPDRSIAAVGGGGGVIPHWRLNVGQRSGPIAEYANEETHYRALYSLKSRK
jgi:hypothetical protein